MAKKLVIAVLDDDASVRAALSRFLKSLGYQAIAFERAEDFLSSDQRRSTACLIADVQMPGMTGLELHSRLVASGEPIPTILITAYPDSAARARALQNGVVCYLPKPFLDDDLLTCIELVVGSPDANGQKHYPGDA